MITLIHGDNKQALYEKYYSSLSKDSPKTEFDLKKDSPEIISQNLAENSLFSEKKTITLRNLTKLHHTKRKKLFEAIKPYKSNRETKIIILSESVFDKKVITQIDADFVFTFELPKYFFEYLDNLLPTKATQVIKLIEKLAVSTDGEQLFYATVNRVRMLLFLKTKQPKDLEEIAKMSPYFEGKLKSQSQKWTEESLVNFYLSLFEIEKGLKTSNLPLSVTKSLDMAVSKHLK